MSSRHLSRSDARHRCCDHHPRSPPSPTTSTPSSSSLLSRFEDKIASQQKELQTLLIDNQRLGATHVALKQELAHSRDEIDRLKAVALRVKAERDAEVREVYERRLKIEAEARAVEVMREELGRVMVDVKTLSVRKKEMGLELKGIESEVVEGKLKLQKFREVREAVAIMRQEVERGRAAVENEKKMHARNQEHGKALEKIMITVVREIERLRAARKDAEKKAVERNTPVVAGNTGTANGATQFTAGPVPYGPYTEQFSVHPHGPYSGNHVNAHR